MADNWGLIGDMASGIREAATTYQTIQQNKRQEQMLGLLHGLQKNQQTGDWELTPQEQMKRDQEQKQYQSFGEPQRQYYKGLTGQELPEGMTPSEYKQFGHLAEAKVRGQTLADMTGRKAADTAFGKEYSEFRAGGGSANLKKNIGLLESAVGDLKSGKVKTGGMTGFLGNDVQDVINPQVSIARDKIRAAIQGTLKQVLGAQFTEKEGEAIFNRAFNPRLSNEENARRVQAELDSLKEMANAKEEATKYFEEHGTLTGFGKKSGKKTQGLIQEKKSAPKRTKALEDMTDEELDAYEKSLGG